jgi:hypothetical protein
VGEGDFVPELPLKKTKIPVQVRTNTQTYRETYRTEYIVVPCTRQVCTSTHPIPASVLILNGWYRYGRPYRSFPRYLSMPREIWPGRISGHSRRRRHDGTDARCKIVVGACGRYCINSLSDSPAGISVNSGPSLAGTRYCRYTLEYRYQPSLK